MRNGIELQTMPAPRPGPLPVGEGELFSVSRRNQLVDLRDNLTVTNKISDAVPSPWGDGQGEGEFNAKYTCDEN
jgi:hypothetical protein